ncbi:phospholipase A1 isoform X2 [Culicoides brevitarsis]|uniref:phospholipase A1 isoform X2 n=1 Tax=Culicoides brevitarsis TaxID=469753 RepID=UPI00307B343D
MKAACNPRVWVGRRPTRATLDTVRLLFFYGTKFEEHLDYSLDEFDKIPEHVKFDPSKPTCLYFHGFVEKMTDEHIYVIADAYQTRNDHNLIMVNWQEMADGSYLLDAVPNMKKIGKTIGQKIVEMTLNKGFPLHKLHVVGHSLGGQLTGYVGRTVIQHSDGKLKVPRISALDPAFPGFYPAIAATHLSYKDAEFVDIIHTDAWLYGTPTSTGSIDFWPNAGKTLQPGCPRRNYKLLSDIDKVMLKLLYKSLNRTFETDLCSHRRSWFFWAESVKNKEPTFHSVKCDSWKQFKEGVYDEKVGVVQMGLNCRMDVPRGDYFLQTNGETPFSRGESGYKYEKLK